MSPKHIVSGGTGGRAVGNEPRQRPFVTSRTGVYRFGPFQLDAPERRLFRDVHQVPFITGRGESTGYTYRVLGSSNSTATFYTAPPNFSGSGNAIFNFGISGGRINLQMHDRMKYSWIQDPTTGEQTVTIAHDDIMFFCH